MNNPGDPVGSGGSGGTGGAEEPGAEEKPDDPDAPKPGTITGRIKVTGGGKLLLEDDVEISGATAANDDKDVADEGEVTKKEAATADGAAANDGQVLGSGIYVEKDGTLNLEGNVEISGNTAENGGGIYVAGDGEVTVKGNVKITGNTANLEITGDGENNNVATHGEVTVKDDVEITGNTAEVKGLGGGVYNAGTFQMEGGAVYGNSAGKAAADFYNAQGGTFTLSKLAEYQWYEDGPENRYTGKKDPLTDLENGEEAYLAAEVTLVGNGTEAAPYQISTPAQLAAFRDIVNGSNGGEKDLDAWAVLMGDIDLSKVCSQEIGSWTPIGLGGSSAYIGTFDGQGHTISNLYCDIFSDENISTLYVGLFGAIGDGDSGTVQNLNVAGDLSASSTKASVDAGGICGQNSGTITGCTFRGSVSASGTSSVAGGICGINQVGGTIENCRNSGTVSASDGTSSTAGGVCGVNAGTVENCLNTGSVTASGEYSNYAGGVCGSNGSNDGGGSVTGAVENCLNTGAVTATGSQTLDIGGVCGVNNNATVTNCYYLTDEDEKPAGIGGSTGQTGTTPTSETKLKSGEVAYQLNGNDAGTENSVWRQDLGKDSCPVPDATHAVVYRTEDGTYTNTLSVEPTPPPYIPPKPTGPSTGDSDGWEDIAEEIGGAEKGDTITIDMNGTTEVPAEIFEEAAGKDVTVEFELEDDISWTVNGQDIPTGTDFSDLDLGVDLGTSGISVDVINTVTGELDSVQITLAHDGAFGFALTLTAPLGKENAGYWANLYHYDEDAKALNFETSGQIDDKGDVALPMTHASQYAIVIDEKSHELPFTDVAGDAWYEPAVRYAYIHGIMEGTGAATFSPKNFLTRAMVAQILYNLEGEPAVTGAAPFDDSSAHWAKTAIAWAQSSGVVNGYEDGTFRPNRFVTRQELAQMLYNYARYKGCDLTASGGLSAFPDGDETAPWAAEAFAWAVGEGFLTGFEDGSVQPLGTATRAQAASILVRFHQNLAEHGTKKAK